MDGKWLEVCLLTMLEMLVGLLAVEAVKFLISWDFVDAMR
jgi:hypothetical protein